MQYAIRVEFMYTVVSKIVCDNGYCSTQNRMRQWILQYPKSSATMGTAVPKMRFWILQYPKLYATIDTAASKTVCDNGYCSTQNRMRQWVLQYPKSYAIMGTAVSKLQHPNL